MIREQYGQRIDEALVEMLKHWLRQVRKPRTWEALIKALKKPSESSYGGGRIAREIEVRYNIILDVTGKKSSYIATSVFSHVVYIIWGHSKINESIVSHLLSATSIVACIPPHYYELLF